MDTHINPHPEFDRRKGPLEVSLPDDPDDLRAHADQQAQRDHDTHPAGGPTAGDRLVAAPDKPRRRHRLLAGAAVVAVVGVGAVVFLVSPYNTYVPAAGLKSAINSVAADAGLRRPLAPSANLARVAAPPLPPPVERGKYQAPPRGSELQEVLALKQGEVPTAHGSAPNTDRAMAGPPPGYVPHEPDASPAPVSQAAPPAPAARSQPAEPAVPPADKADLTAAIVAGMHRPDGAMPKSGSPGTQSGPTAGADDRDNAPPAAPAKIAAASPPSAVPVAASPAPSAPLPQPDLAALAASDPVAALKGVQAAPMSSPQQVQVLELVTRLATLVGDQRREVDQLRADLSKTRSDDETRIDDFQRRLTLAEAARAVTSAADPAADARAATVPASMPVPAASPSIVKPALVLARTPVPADDAVHRYRVQAASPGLAMLAQVDRAGDEGAQLQVSLGDEVPGYGKVKAVAQRGTTWVVVTEHGTIGQ